MKTPPSAEQRQLAYLHDMLDSAQHVLRYVNKIDFDDFWDSSEKRDAVALRLTVIGEAASHITLATEKRLPGVPFKLIRGMRNRIAHEYGHVNFRIVWEVSQNDIPKLVEELVIFFEKLPSDESLPLARPTPK